MSPVFFVFVLLLLSVSLRQGLTMYPGWLKQAGFVFVFFMQSYIVQADMTYTAKDNLELLFLPALLLEC